MEDGESGRLHHLPKVTQLKTEFNKVQIPESKLSAPRTLYVEVTKHGSRSHGLTFCR